MTNLLRADDGSEMTVRGNALARWLFWLALYCGLTIVVTLPQEVAVRRAIDDLLERSRVP